MPADSEDKKVDVTVDDGQNVTCDPDVLNVKKSGQIKWLMKTAGWKISDVSGLPSGSGNDKPFDDPGKDGKDYKIHYKGDQGEWNYTVSVEPDSSVPNPPTLSVDPSIRNLPDR